MNTTDSDQLVPRRAKGFPSLKVLFATGKILAADEQGRALRVGQTYLGRDISSDDGIALPGDGRASRRHAVIEMDPQGDKVTLRDLGSKNGCFVNGLPIQAASLVDGDVLRLGNTVLLFRDEENTAQDADCPALLGSAPAVRKLRHRLAQVAPRPEPTLIQGESGTGKEVAAQALHGLSGRRGKLVAVNCASIPAELAESELFGHVAGAFSGARAPSVGYFRAAHTGTLFLDEMGELPLLLQPKLLRALEQQAIVPVGSTTPIACDVRIIAATNRDLLASVRTGQFRGDLYARLSGFVLEVPPLRERQEDILLLLRETLGSAGRPLTARLAEALILYVWPFNIRELKQVAADLNSHAKDEPVFDLNLIEERLDRGRALLPTEVSDAAVARAARGGASSPLEQSDSLIEQSEHPRIPREVLLRLMQENDGIVQRVARAVGRSRRQVGRWLEYYGIKSKEFRA